MRCPFCKRMKLQDTHGYGEGLREIPGWRCGACGIKIVVTNPSYLPEEVRRQHPTCKRQAIADGRRKHA